MKKPNKKIIEIKDCVFRSAISIFVGYTYKELKELLMKKGLPTDFDCSGDDASQITLEDGNVLYNIIWLPIDDFTLYGQSLLSHELIHFLYRLKEQKGFKDEETFAYLYEYYFYEASKKILDFYDKNKRKSRSKQKTGKESKENKTTNKEATRD